MPQNIMAVNNESDDDFDNMMWNNMNFEEIHDNDIWGSDESKMPKKTDRSSMLPQEIWEKILKETDRPSLMSIFARNNKYTHKLYNHAINDVFAPTENTLHNAIINSATDTVILSIIDKIKHTEYTLHNAIMLNATDTVILYLIDKTEWPTVHDAQEMDLFGSPLHCAIRSDSSMNIINTLIERYKLKTPHVPLVTNGGETPLDLAVGFTRLIRTKRYTTNPPNHKYARCQEYTTNMALKITQDNKSVDMVEALLNAWPNTIHWKILGIAIKNYACLDVIQTLITYDPGMVKEFSPHPDFEGNYNDDDEFEHTNVLALHLAAHINSEFPIIKLLIELYPESIKIQDETYQRTALHWALAEKHRISSNGEDNIETIAYLLKIWPDATTILDVNNNSPIEMEIQRHEARMYQMHITLNPFILVTLMRMYLNNDYPDESNDVNWKADTATLKKNMQLRNTPQHTQRIVVHLTKEIEKHEKDINNDNVTCTTEEVIRIFKRYKEEKRRNT